jgi:hypothetical protein
MQDIEQTIRERAYHLWLENGAHDGNADAHRLAAQRDVLSASLGELDRVTKASKALKTKGPRKKKRAA